jgi:DNA-binding NarL/FixJ family response regulator
VLDRYARDTWCIPSAWPVSAIQRLPAGRGLIEVPGDVGDYSDRGRTVGATEARIDMKRLESAVAEQLASKLTPQQWKIMYLSSACGWSDQEIASDLNLPRATIARTLREVERIFRELDGE